MAEPQPRRRPTLAEVADALGVSQATVSRALSDSPLVNERTRRRVWEVATGLGFRPNRLARSLRSGATMAVGVLVPDVASTFYAAALKAAQEVLEGSGYHVLVANSERAAWRERDALLTLRAHQVDGMLVATCGGFVDIGVPAIFFDNMPNEEDAAGVLLDNAAGTSLLVEHLAAAHGHERIAYVGPPEAVGEGASVLLRGTGRERLEAFRSAVGRMGLPLPPEYVRSSDWAGSEAFASLIAGELLALERPPTAIVAGTDTLAVGLLRGVREGMRRIPDDVAVVSFDEPLYADVLDPPLTSLDRHDRELGRRAAELLLGRLGTGNGTDGHQGVLRVPPVLRIRRSCGCGA